MKKIILHTILSGVVVSSSQAAVFNGYSVGLTAGVLMTKDKTNVTQKVDRIDRGLVDRIDRGLILTTKLKGDFGAYGIHFDYDRSQPNAFYWGAGVDFMIYSPSKKSNYWVVRKNKYVSDAYEKIKYSWSTELDGRFGWNLENRVALYALAGVRLYNKKTNGQFAEGEKMRFKTIKRTYVTPVLGAGCKYKISNHISTGIEYRYAFARSERNTHKASFRRGKRRIAFALMERHNKHSSQAVLAKLSYHF